MNYGFKFLFCSVKDEGMRIGIGWRWLKLVFDEHLEFQLLVFDSPHANRWGVWEKNPANE